MINPFDKTRHHLFEVIDFDKRYDVPSSFFFGMRTGLGMSYNRENAIDLIKSIDSMGFDVGVHGIEFDDPKIMMEE